MATINLKDNQQVIDYLARDFSSFRQALLNLVPAKLPEWTDRSEANFGVVLIELFAYMADILGYYQDRIANEMFLPTVQERRNAIQHLRLIGYEMVPAAAAGARLSIVVGNNITQSVEVRKGDQFSTPSTPDRPSVTFEYTDDKPLVIDLSVSTLRPATKPDGSRLPGFKEAVSVIPVREGRSVLNEVVGISDGTPNQRYPLAQPRVLSGSIDLRAATTPPTPSWRLRTNLVYSGRAFTPEQLAALEQQDRIGSTLAFSRSPDPDYATETDENDVTTVLFGDGQFGMIPPVGVPILASYRTGGGAVGNVGAGQITQVVRSAQLQVLGAKVINRVPASGGADRESIAEAVKFAPTVFSSMQRAVTADDYVAQARLFPGVSKARAEATNWNVIKLYIAPTGSGDLPSDILRRDLLAYFEDKRMVTTLIQVEDPDYAQIEVQAEINALSYFRNDDVLASAQAAVAALFAFDSVDFAQILYLSKVYEALEALPGVDNVFVSRFQRAGDPTNFTPDGRIVLGQNEIPVLRPKPNNLTVKGGVDAAA
jgi:Baseplate J-like protein